MPKLYIIPDRNAWPEQVGSVIKRINTNKRSTLKSDALNAITMVLINGPKCGIPEASYLIKQTSMSLGESKKRYKETSTVQKKEACKQTLVSRAQTEILHVESESQIDTDKTFGCNHHIRHIYCLKLNGNEL